MSRPRRVVVGTGALALATFVSLVCCATVLAFLVGSWIPWWQALMMTVIWGVLPSIALAFCLGVPLAMLLQPVRNQWLHVAAFAGLGVVLGIAFALLASGPAPRTDYVLTFAATAALTCGGALAVGRLSIWRLVRLDQDGTARDGTVRDATAHDGAPDSADQVSASQDGGNQQGKVPQNPTVQDEPSIDLQTNQDRFQN
ncbi:hypothetical protein [Arthrobacter sp. P2b]|uniref:hypothetical protein n=1 Tax=Arthrobacter sp. P2b TaxID=1938741 RepID=UPI0009A697B7|nr:hypothetical protein [Arthrobacter sp. P2b]SLK09926.1 hypothetical protein SAMN06272721_11238 [Arthrobacter sp. P2b]